MTLLAETQSPAQSYLRFDLDADNSALIPVESIAEIVTFDPRDILPVPEMPESVWGIRNWRSEMLWMVDLSHLLGFTALSQQSQHSRPMTAIVVQHEDRSLGLAIARVSDIETYDRAQLQSASTQLFSAQTLPFLQGFTIDNQDEIVMTLDPSTIFQHPQWQQHRQ
jgi:positive phototaxis protein PixI